MVALADTPVAQNESNTEFSERVYSFNPFRVRPFPGQIRKRFRGIKGLASSIQEIGQTSPIKVKLLYDDTHYDAELIDGERRLKACQMIDVKIRAVAKSEPEIIDERTQFAQCVAANFGNQPHDAIEIMEAILQLTRDGKTQQQIANTFGGKSPGWVAQYSSLQYLDPRVQELLIPEDEDLDEGPLSTVKKNSKEKRKAPLPFSIALLLVPLTPPAQWEVAEKIISEKMTMVAARRHILALRRESGSACRSNKRPRETWQALDTLTTSIRDRFGVYLDMSFPDLQRIIASGGLDNQVALAIRLEKLSEDIAQLAGELKRKDSK